MWDFHSQQNLIKILDTSYVIFTYENLQLFYKYFSMELHDFLGVNLFDIFKDIVTLWDKGVLLVIHVTLIYLNLTDKTPIKFNFYLEDKS